MPVNTDTRVPLPAIPQSSTQPLPSRYVDADQILALSTEQSIQSRDPTRGFDTSEHPRLQQKEFSNTITEATSSTPSSLPAPFPNNILTKVNKEEEEKEAKEEEGTEKSVEEKAQEKFREISFGEVQIISKIGSGSYGIVYKVLAS